MFEKVYEIKLSQKSSCLEKFLWIGKRYFGQRCRTFLPLLGNIFSSKSDFFYGNIFLEKNILQDLCPASMTHFWPHAETFCQFWNIFTSIRRKCWKISVFEDGAGGFLSEVHKILAQIPKKIKFSSRKFFLKTSSGHINCILTDFGEKNSEKVHTSSSHVRRNLLKTLFLKNQKALKWLFQHVKLTFVIPADSFLPNVQDFCSKSKKTNENKNSPKKLLPQKFVLTRNMQFWQHCQIYSAKHPQQLQRKFSNFWLLLFFPNELFPGNMFSCT